MEGDPTTFPHGVCRAPNLGTRSARIGSDYRLLVLPGPEPGRNPEWDKSERGAAVQRHNFKVKRLRRNRGRFIRTVNRRLLRLQRHLVLADKMVEKLCSSFEKVSSHYGLDFEFHAGNRASVLRLYSMFDGRHEVFDETYCTFDDHPIHDPRTDGRSWMVMTMPSRSIAERRARYLVSEECGVSVRRECCGGLAGSDGELIPNLVHPGFVYPEEASAPVVGTVLLCPVCARFRHLVHDGVESL